MEKSMERAEFRYEWHASDEKGEMTGLWKVRYFFCKHACVSNGLRVYNMNIGDELRRK